MSRNLIAILRGVTNKEVVEIGQVIIDAGFNTIEVPLNSPNALESIRLLSDAYGESTLIGAGTVLTVDGVHGVATAGGKVVVSPDCNPDVIKATKDSGMLSYPGVLSPTECFSALRHGADGLKFFPSFLLGPKGLAALLAVLPAGTQTYAVGGVGPDNFSAWLEAGVSGFGIGSNLFKAGLSVDEVGQNARDIVLAYDQAVQLFT